jgi:hypothetical protein
VPCTSPEQLKKIPRAPVDQKESRALEGVGDSRKALRLTESQWQLWEASIASAVCLRGRRDHKLGCRSCNGRGVISVIMPAEIDVKPRTALDVRD